jgi:hypothetical protein
MKRRDFVKKVGLTAAAAVAVPYILPSGRLFAATGSRRANHVVFVLFAGGVRNLESVHKNDGNLMPNLLNGNEAISSDIVNSMSPLPASPLTQPLQNFGTLYKNFRFSDGPTGHFNGHTTAITGQHTNNTLSLREHPTSPTVFELYRKHTNPKGSALNTWWVSHTNNLYPILNYSQYPGYGPDYGANQISPASFFSSRTKDVLDDELNLGSDEKAAVEEMRAFLNYNFTGSTNGLSNIKNTPEEAEQVQAWIKKMITDYKAGLHSNPWNIPGFMNGDMRNVFYAEEIIKEFKPELLVVNMFGVDAAHTDFSTYCDNLRKADWAAAKLWSTIQSTAGMADDTVMIVAPEIGRNSTPNSIVDANGRGALDHTSDDPMSRELFCLVTGPQGVVNQGKTIGAVEGESIDIVPTIGDILDFKHATGGILPGKVLNGAFV